MADQRYERLKDQLTRVERRYEDLLAGVGTKLAEPVVQSNQAAPEDSAALEEVPIMAESQMAESHMAESQMAESQGSLVPLATPPPSPGGPIEREERGRIQELEERSARTRQRLEEELGRVRHQLEEEVARSRRQKDEQVAVADANRQLEQQVFNSNRQLEEKQRIISDLEGQLRSDRQKIEELVNKLRNNSQLLMNIYQELDKSLHFNDMPKEP
jgi:signal recognition particle GTPase